MNVEVMAGYKQTEVGVIPEDWEICPLGDIAGLEVGYAFKSAWFRENDGVPLLRGENVGYGRPDWSETKRLSQKQASTLPTYVLRPGDIVIGMDRTFTKSGTKISILQQKDCPCLLVQRVGKFVPLKCSGTFLWAILSSKRFRESLQVEQKGMDIPHLSRSEILHPLVAFPPTKAEQEAIAEVLSDADALIESLEQLIAQKRQIKQGAMQELLTGKKRLPGFSMEWEVKTFGEIFDYHPTATNSRSDLLDGGNTFYIHYGDIHTRFHSHLDFKVAQPPRINRERCKNAALLQNGDWIMVDASEDYDGVGKSIEILNLDEGVLAVAGLHTFLLREKCPTFAPGFKGHLGNLKSLHDQFLRVATGMKVFGVSKTALKDLLLHVPSIAEQIAIAAILSDMDAEIAALEAKLAKARQLKQGMMHNLLTGRIRLV